MTNMLMASPAKQRVGIYQQVSDPFKSTIRRDNPVMSETDSPIHDKQSWDIPKLEIKQLDIDCR